MSPAAASPNETVDPPEVIREKAGVDRTVALLAEYRKKLRVMKRRLLELKGEADGLASGINQSVETLRKRKDLHDTRAQFVHHSRPVVSAAEELARYASGLIEGARIPQIDKVELQLRNAELEAELIQVQRLVK